MRVFRVLRTTAGRYFVAVVLVAGATVLSAGAVAWFFMPPLEQHHAELLLREKLGRAKSESMEWRYTALADAAGVVARARDAKTALERITHLAVPRFAAASAVHVPQPNGGALADLAFAQDLAYHAALVLARA